MKFTSPKKYPAQYRIRNGKATIAGYLPAHCLYYGYADMDDGNIWGHMWNLDGSDPEEVGFDLSDDPQRLILTRGFITDERRGMHIIECDVDGSNPTVKWEPVK